MMIIMMSQNKYPFSLSKDNCCQQFLKTLNFMKTLMDKKLQMQDTDGYFEKSGELS